jgi:hypothetical protein
VEEQLISLSVEVAIGENNWINQRLKHGYKCSRRCWPSPRKKKITMVSEVEKGVVKNIQPTCSASQIIMSLHIFAKNNYAEAMCQSNTAID